MRATTIHGPRDIRVSEVPDPTIQAPQDAVVRVVAACVCGSDLWRYRGEAKEGQIARIGHEFIGVVEEVGAEVGALRPGDFVISPFMYSDGTCAHCRNGVQTSCSSGGFWAAPDRWGRPVDGAQGERVRVPFAEGTLVVVPEVPADGGPLAADLLSLSDVMGTGHHAAVSARVRAGSTVAVVGDGAVGLSAVLAAHRLGAERIIAMSRHETRSALARRFGATDVVAERGAEGAKAVAELLGGIGPDAVLECVGTADSMAQALATVRPGGSIGYVGLPHGIQLPVRDMFLNNIGVAGGMAPVRAYLPELLADVLAGAIRPGLVFDLELPLAEIGEAYLAMDERRAIKVLVRP